MAVSNLRADAVLSPPFKFEPVPALMLPPPQSEEVAQSSSDSDNAKLLDETMNSLGENVLKTRNDYFYEDEAAVDEGDASKQANQGREGKVKVEPSKVRNRKGFNVASLSDACIQRLFSLCLSVCPFLLSITVENSGNCTLKCTGSGTEEDAQVVHQNGNGRR